MHLSDNQTRLCVFVTPRQRLSEKHKVALYISCFCETAAQFKLVVRCDLLRLMYFFMSSRIIQIVFQFFLHLNAPC